MQKHPPPGTRPYLGVERLLDGCPSLDFGFAALNLRHDAINVLQLVTPLPEDGAVLHHFLRSLAFHLFGDVLDVVAPVLLVGLDELVKVALRPRREALRSKVKTSRSCGDTADRILFRQHSGRRQNYLRQQPLLLHLFVLGERLGLVNFTLLLALHLDRFGAEFRIARNFVAHRLTVVVDLLIQQLKESRREKLKVLHDRLFGWTRSLIQENANERTRPE